MQRDSLMRGCLLLAGLLAAAATSGCHMGLLMVAAGAATDQGPYRPETIANELGPEAVRTLGCLDVGFALYERDGVDLLDVHIGNRCAHPEALDIRRLTFRGVDRAGATRSVTLYDPRSEIVRLQVGGAERGRERLKLEGANGLTRLCLDLEAIAPDAPEARPAALCFNERNGWRATVAGLGGLT